MSKNKKPEGGSVMEKRELEDSEVLASFDDDSTPDDIKSFVLALMSAFEMDVGEIKKLTAGLIQAKKIMSIGDIESRLGSLLLAQGNVFAEKGVVKALDFIISEEGKELSTKERLESLEQVLKEPEPEEPSVVIEPKEPGKGVEIKIKDAEGKSVSALEVKGKGDNAGDVSVKKNLDVNGDGTFNGKVLIADDQITEDSVTTDDSVVGKRDVLKSFRDIEYHLTDDAGYRTFTGYEGERTGLGVKRKDGKTFVHITASYDEVDDKPLLGFYNENPKTPYDVGEDATFRKNVEVSGKIYYANESGAKQEEDLYATIVALKSRITALEDDLEKQKNSKVEGSLARSILGVRQELERQKDVDVEGSLASGIYQVKSDLDHERDASEDGTLAQKIVASREEGDRMIAGVSEDLAAAEEYFENKIVLVEGDLADQKDSSKPGTLAKKIADAVGEIEKQKDVSQPGTLAKKIAANKDLIEEKAKSLGEQVEDVNQDLQNQKDKGVSGSLASDIEVVSSELANQKNESVDGSLAQGIASVRGDLALQKDESKNGLAGGIKANREEIARQKNASLPATLAAAIEANKASIGGVWDDLQNQKNDAFGGGLAHKIKTGLETLRQKHNESANNFTQGFDVVSPGGTFQNRLTAGAFYNDADSYQMVRAMGTIEVVGSEKQVIVELRDDDGVIERQLFNVNGSGRKSLGFRMDGLTLSENIEVVARSVGANERLVGRLRGAVIFVGLDKTMPW